MPPTIDETSTATMMPWEETNLAMLWDDDNGGQEQRMTFPAMLHALLSAGRNDDIVSFMPHGRAFKIHDHARFCNEVLSSWGQTGSRYHQLAQDGSMDWETFLDLLSRFGFRCMEAPGPDQGAYYHELFLRGQEHLAKRIVERPRHGRQPRFNSAVPDFSPMPQLGRPTAVDGTMSLPSLLVSALSEPPAGHRGNRVPPPPFGAAPQQDLAATLADILAESYRLVMEHDDMDHHMMEMEGHGHAAEDLVIPYRDAHE